MLGLNFFAGLFSSILVIVIGALTVWAYARYSGTLREASGWVDDAVTFLWTNFISPNAGQLGALGGAIQLGDKLTNSSNASTSNSLRERKKK
ncbi:hypothetical protein TELCIR_03843 [Teladorsagia circumcincta]|uniref:Uncharacterized protein n=1 Tax=Teladorsagia circumcincta TaxID=45464 RepID=A0A2G9UXB8_TELCI|nr:hypothetical protein TELCIR_15633 [Teladorsagia circumcincta]PIO74160.1 hypothetical protein TELCIR_03843 [Teladorsagia circumcincta]